MRERFRTAICDDPLLCKIQGKGANLHVHVEYRTLIRRGGFPNEWPLEPATPPTCPAPGPGPVTFDDSCPVIRPLPQ